MSSRQARAFQRIRRTCEEEGIQLLLINPPQLCEEVFEKPVVMKGVPWIEGNDWPLAKVDTLYYDDHHFRGVGAELYSAWLADQVVALMGGGSASQLRRVRCRGNGRGSSAESGGSSGAMAPLPISQNA